MWRLMWRLLLAAPATIAGLLLTGMAVTMFLMAVGLHRISRSLAFAGIYCTETARQTAEV